MIKFFIDRHGCAKNQTDAELITGFLLKRGFVHTENPDEADFIIINSCGFIESAKKESIDAIYEIRSSYPDVKIILAGCLAERYASSLYESVPELDGIFGNGDLSKIADFMEKVSAGERVVQTFEQKGVCSGERPVLYNFKSSAYVKITEGCSNHCSFCAIPLIRGEVRSRKAKEIIEEINDLLKRNIYEINLIGQDLAAYGTGTEDSDIFEGTEYSGKSFVCESADEIVSFIQKPVQKSDEVEESSQSALCLLFKLISRLKGDFIIRPLYIHPDHFNLDILNVMKNDRRFVPYFDIPFQSGADKTIRAMNRKGSYEKYVNLVGKIREVLPETVLRTTFLTGFPGETEEDAKVTRDFLQVIKPQWSGCFPYSREEDTPAYNLKPRIAQKIAAKRAQQLEEIQVSITENQLTKYVGTETKVLIEEIIEVDENNTEEDELFEGLAIGRAWFQAPEVDGNVVVRYDRDDEKQNAVMKSGNVVNVQVIAVSGVDLDSRLI